MKIIIDGYNLLMACGFVSPNRIGPGTLRRGRQMMIGILKKKLPPHEQEQTVVVFDSAERHEHLDFIENCLPIRVQFATEFEDADSMIEFLVRQHSAPRTLTVVSCDHQVQAAARRRKSIAIDSDDWFFDQIGNSKNEDRIAQRKSIDELLKLNELEMDPQDSINWLDEFSQLPTDVTGPSQSLVDGPSPTAKDQEKTDVWNPFPEDYGDDLLEE